MAKFEDGRLFVVIRNTSEKVYTVWWRLIYDDAVGTHEKAVGKIVIQPKTSWQEEHSIFSGATNWRTEKLGEAEGIA